MLLGPTLGNIPGTLVRTLFAAITDGTRVRLRVATKACIAIICRLTEACRRELFHPNQHARDLREISTVQQRD